MADIHATRPPLSAGSNALKRNDVQQLFSPYNDRLWCRLASSVHSVMSHSIFFAMCRKSEKQLCFRAVTVSMRSQQSQIYRFDKILSLRRIQQASTLTTLQYVSSTIARTRRRDFPYGKRGAADRHSEFGDSNMFEDNRIARSESEGGVRIFLTAEAICGDAAFLNINPTDKSGKQVAHGQANENCMSSMPSTPTGPCTGPSRELR
jgi:hypothetical protein